MIESFIPQFSEPAWQDLRSRLRRTRWPDELPGSNWLGGLAREFLIDLCSYWSEHFDWAAQVERLRLFPHYQFHSSGGKIHFLHMQGHGPAPVPIILTHGWPGSFVEMLELVPLLTNPAAHGIKTEKTFDVVVPSLPGFGYSDQPKSLGMDVFRVAEIWVELMQALGYERFAAQGGDIGAAVSTALGLRHSEHLVGLHLNYIPGSYKPYLATDAVLREDESTFLTTAADWYDKNGAYAHLQGTRPQTPAYALNDSPAGLAAWILEKFQEWSDCADNLYNSFSRDVLLSNVTLYWMTQTIGSSFRMYQEGRWHPLRFSQTDYVDAPTAIAIFPKEIVMPPRSWVERGYNVKRWTSMPKGGHFAAAEQPGALAADIHSFFGVL